MATTYGSYAWGTGSHGENATAFPDKCPDKWMDAVNSMTGGPLNNLERNKVPYYIIQRLAHLDYTMLGDIADRFTASTTCNETTAAMLELKEADYTEEQGSKYLRRLIRAATACATEVESKDKAERIVGKVGALEPATAKDLRETFKHKEGFQFPLEYEGSEAYEAKQFKETQRGQLGTFTNKQIIGRLPDFTVRQNKSQIPVDSNLVEVVNETKSDPDTPERWIQQMRVFYYTLTKCIYGSSSYKIFADWSLRDAKQYYEDFLFSDQILKRKDNPTVKTIMIAERKAWAEIELDIYKNECTLKQAVKNIMAKTLFWTNELQAGARAASEKSRNKGKQGWNNSKGKGQNSKGKGKSGGKNKGKSISNFSRTGKGNSNNGTQKGGKGKGSKGNKGSGKYKHNNTRESCWNFHHGRGCTGGCGRTHQCPICGQTHRQADHH